MQQPIKWVMGNWKMNPNLESVLSLVDDLKQLSNHCSTRIAVFPTLLHALTVKQALSATFDVGAQDVSVFQQTGAFTGETSAQLLQDSGLQLVLIGHSERRHVMNETATQRQKKVESALQAGLKVVLCVGETLQEREAGQAESVVKQQILEQIALFDVSNMSQLIIAYEPVWAIGTGKTASAEDANAMHQFIRSTLIALQAEFKQISVLYGGSVKADNAHVFACCSDIDGVLVGGASLDAESFKQIIDAFSK